MSKNAGLDEASPIAGRTLHHAFVAATVRRPQSAVAETLGVAARKAIGVAHGCIRRVVDNTPYLSGNP